MRSFWSSRKWNLVLCGFVLVAVAVLGSASPLIAGEGQEQSCQGKLEECLEYLANKMKSSGWVGVELEVNKAKGTYTVQKVLRESPAEAAGIRAGDRLLAINDVRRADEFRDLAERLRLRTGDLVRIQLQREGRRYDLSLRAVERPRELLTSQMLRLSFQPDSMVESGG